MFFSASKEHADCVEEVWQPIWQEAEREDKDAQPPAKRQKVEPGEESAEPAEPAEKSKGDDDQGNKES